MSNTAPALRPRSDIRVDLQVMANMVAPNSRVLDVGCGDGDISFFLESLGARVDAVDNAPTNYNALYGVRALKEALHSPIRIQATDIDQHPLRGQIISTVTCNQLVNIGGITCDSDDYYNNESHVNQVYLPDKDRTPEDPLYIGFFHTGAYQESIGGYGGIQHCLIPAPKHVIIDRDEDGEVSTRLFAKEQSAKSMLKILGY